MKLPETTSFGTKLIVAGVLFFGSFATVLVFVRLLGLTLDPQKDFVWFYGPIAIACLGLNFVYAKLSKFDQSATMLQFGAAAIVVVLPVLAVALRA